jgi:radical SAM protein with 4Fe4S-binding SPASM domain
VRVEADGTVYAPRGPGIACGNLLKQRWARIWQHPAFRRHRLGEAAPGRCPTCPGLALCDGGCVKDPSGWSDDTEGASK